MDQIPLMRKFKEFLNKICTPYTHATVKSYNNCMLHNIFLRIYKNSHSAWNRGYIKYIIQIFEGERAGRALYNV